MMDEDRYLICRVGGYSIAIAATLRIWEADTSDPIYSTPPVDLRELLNNTSGNAAIAVAFQAADRVCVSLVDSIIRMVNIADDEFVRLPECFGFARRFFDAACRHAIGGGYPLRLRRQADFTSPL